MAGGAGYSRKTAYLTGPVHRGDGRKPKQRARRRKIINGKLHELHPNKGWRAVRADS